MACRRQGFAESFAEDGLCRRHDGANRSKAAATTEPGWRADEVQGFLQSPAS
ncbi:MAG TPA: hypothetical protein VF412_04020 [Bdellovibrio sp.]|uniref:hypothetical protein n=1 Tax=Bdellovibrio sp. TaxID=28201 RepID=UPI002EDC5ADF